MSEVTFFLSNHCLKWGLVLGLILVIVFPGSITAEEMPCRPNPPYEAFEYKVPSTETRKSRLRLESNGNGNPH